MAHAYSYNVRPDIFDNISRGRRIFFIFYKVFVQSLKRIHTLHRFVRNRLCTTCIGFPYTINARNAWCYEATVLSHEVLKHRKCFIPIVRLLLTRVWNRFQRDLNTFGGPGSFAGLRCSLWKNFSAIGPRPLLHASSPRKPCDYVQLLHMRRTIYFSHPRNT